MLSSLAWQDQAESLKQSQHGANCHPVFEFAEICPNVASPIFNHGTMLFFSCDRGRGPVDAQNPATLRILKTLYLRYFSYQLVIAGFCPSDMVGEKSGW